MTRVLPANDATIGEAAAILRRGGRVAFPTETVYGLGADAENEAALKALFAAKGRPADHPVIMHLAESELVHDFVAEMPPAARKLAMSFWPGPMTLVLRRNRRVSNLVTGGLDTVGLRVPAHPVAHALLKEFAGPIAAPSANRFGRVSCTRADHVASELEERVDLILDGGPCKVGLESTIIDVSSRQPAILRPGAITQEQVVAALGETLQPPSATSPRAPGTLASHYAPQALVEVVEPSMLAPRAKVLASSGKKVAVLGRNLTRFATCDNIICLDGPPDDEGLAHELYALLRRADESGCDVVLAALPKQQGIGTAITDRLRRAAGPR